MWDLPVIERIGDAMACGETPLCEFEAAERIARHLEDGVGFQLRERVLDDLQEISGAGVGRGQGDSVWSTGHDGSFR